MDRRRSLKAREIVWQCDLPDRRGSFGPLGNVAANGCGSVALYHVLRLLGQPVRYESVLEKMNREWYKSMVAGGLLGTNPLYLWRVIRRVPGVCCHISVYVGTMRRRVGRDGIAVGRDGIAVGRDGSAAGRDGNVADGDRSAADGDGSAAGRDGNAARERAAGRGSEGQIQVNLYLHRRGAHYTVSEYRDGEFHVYNDQCRSRDHAGYFEESGALAMIVMRIVQKEES